MLVRVVVRVVVRVKVGVGVRVKVKVKVKVKDGRIIRLSCTSYYAILCSIITYNTLHYEHTIVSLSPCYSH